MFLHKGVCRFEVRPTKLLWQIFPWRPKKGLCKKTHWISFALFSRCSFFSHLFSVKINQLREKHITTCYSRCNLCRSKIRELQRSYCPQGAFCTAGVTTPTGEQDLGPGLRSGNAQAPNTQATVNFNSDSNEENRRIIDFFLTEEWGARRCKHCNCIVLRFVFSFPPHFWHFPLF